MAIMRYTIIDNNGTVSFIAPWNTLKALTAGCCRKPAPHSLQALLEAATKYDSKLQDYVLNGLAVFDEHRLSAGEVVAELSLELERELQQLLAGNDNRPATGRASDYFGSGEVEEPVEGVSGGELEPVTNISYSELLEKQARLSGAYLSRHPVLRVLDDRTRQESLEPVRIGLVIFNLPARRIIQVQNTYGILKRSDRGRYFEDGQPTERLYFYRLPDSWSLLP